MRLPSTANSRKLRRKWLLRMLSPWAPALSAHSIAFARSTRATSLPVPACSSFPARSRASSPTQAPNCPGSGSIPQRAYTPSARPARSGAITCTRPSCNTPSAAPCSSPASASARPSLLRHAPTRGRQRYSHDPSPSRPQGPCHDDDIHARPQPRPRRSALARRPTVRRPPVNRSAPSPLAPAARGIPTSGWRLAPHAYLQFGTNHFLPQSLRQTCPTKESSSGQACPIPSPQPHLRRRSQLEFILGRHARRLQGYYAGLPNTPCVRRHELVA